MRRRKLRPRQVNPLVHECVARKCRSWACNPRCLTPELPLGLRSPSPQANAQGPPQWGSHGSGCFPSASTPTQQSSHMPGDPPQTPLGPPCHTLASAMSSTWGGLHRRKPAHPTRPVSQASCSAELLMRAEWVPPQSSRPGEDPG